MLLRTVFSRENVEGISRKEIYRNILRLLFPVMMEFLLLQLVHMFDQMQVGRIGESAIAAVGLSGQIVDLLNTLFISVNIGVTVLVANAFGQKKTEAIPQFVRHGMLITFAFSLVIAITGLSIAEPLLRLMNAPDATTLQMGVTYFRICMIGLIPVALTATVTATLRGIGNTKWPMLYNVAANLINITLNWVLINGNLGMPKLGVKGAAIATVIGQSFAFFAAMALCFRKRNPFGMHISSMLSKYRFGYVKELLHISIPSVLEHGIGKFGTAVFTAIVATLGTTNYAAHVICISIQQLTRVTGSSFSTVATTFTGQSIGAKRKDLAVMYSCYCVKLCLAFSVLLMGVYALLGSRLIGLYNPDPTIIATGTKLLRIVAIMQPFTAFQYVLAGAMRGAGDTKSVAICYIIAQLICRPGFAYIAIHFLNLGLSGAWWSLICAESICALLISLRFASRKWMRFSDAGIEQEA